MTHKKIAEIAHVSASTVSKALAGSREISAELTEKIVQIAIDTGYFKEKSKRKLDYSKEKNTVIAILCPEIISIYYSGIVTVIKNAVENNGGQLAIYVFDFDVNKLNNIIETIILKQLAGGIIVLSQKHKNFTNSVPMLYFTPSGNDTSSSIFPDTQLVLDLATEHLKNLGHTKIGFIGENLTHSKLAAFRSSLKKYKLPINESFIYSSAERFEKSGFTAVKQMLAAPVMPTAFIAAYDEIALAVIHELAQHGIRVPDDISIIGINDIPAASYSQIPLTTVSCFSEERCINAINALFDTIFDKPKGIRYIHFKPELILRSSTSKPKTEAKS